MTDAISNKGGADIGPTFVITFALPMADVHDKATRSKNMSSIISLKKYND